MTKSNSQKQKKHSTPHSPGNFGRQRKATTITNNQEAMEKVKIKRVKRDKKKPSTKEKVLAGLGLGSTLLGGVAAVAPKTSSTQFVRNQEQSSNTSKVKQTLRKIFGVQKAQASDEGLDAWYAQAKADVDAGYFGEGSAQRLADIEAAYQAAGGGQQVTPPPANEGPEAELPTETVVSQPPVNSLPTPTPIEQTSQYEVYENTDNERGDVQRQAYVDGYGIVTVSNGKAYDSNGQEITGSQAQELVEQFESSTPVASNVTPQTQTPPIEPPVTPPPATTPPETVTPPAAQQYEVYENRDNERAEVQRQAYVDGQGLVTVSNGKAYNEQGQEITGVAGQELVEQFQATTPVRSDIQTNYDVWKTDQGAGAYVEGYGFVTLGNDGIARDADGNDLSSKLKEDANLLNAVYQIQNKKATNNVQNPDFQPGVPVETTVTEVSPGSPVRETLTLTETPPPTTPPPAVSSDTITGSLGTASYSSWTTVANPELQQVIQGMAGASYKVNVLKAADGSTSYAFTVTRPNGTTATKTFSSAQEVNDFLSENWRVMDNFLALSPDEQAIFVAAADARSKSPELSAIAVGKIPVGSTSSYLHHTLIDQNTGIDPMYFSTSQEAEAWAKLFPGATVIEEAPPTSPGSTMNWDPNDPRRMFALKLPDGSTVNIGYLRQSSTYDGNGRLIVSGISEDQAQYLESAPTVVSQYKQAAEVGPASSKAELIGPTRLFHSEEDFLQWFADNHYNSDGSLLRVPDPVVAANYKLITGKEWQQTDPPPVKVSPDFKPTFLEVQGTNAYDNSTFHVNDQYFATPETAQWLADKYGGEIFTKLYQGTGGPYAATQPEYWIRFEDGTEVNAGALASIYARNSQSSQPGYADTVVRQTIAAEQYYHAGGAVGTWNPGEALAKGGMGEVSGDTILKNAPPVASGLEAQRLSTAAVTTTVPVGSDLNTAAETEASVSVVITHLASFDVNGQNRQGKISQGDHIEIGGTGLEAYSSFSLVAGGRDFSVTRAVITNNKITLVVPELAGVANGSVIQVRVGAKNVSVAQGLLAGSFTYESTETMTSGASGGGVVQIDQSDTAALGGQIQDIQDQITDQQNQINTLTNTLSSGNSGDNTTVMRQIQQLTEDNARLEREVRALSVEYNARIAGAAAFQGLQMPPGYAASEQSAQPAWGLQYDELRAAQTAPAVQGTQTAESQTYTVKKGDTLWGIAKKYYGDGRKWRKILEANTSKVKNPQTLKIGTELVIPKL